MQRAEGNKIERMQHLLYYIDMSIYMHNMYMYMYV